MKMKTGFKTVLALSLCFIMAAAFIISCGGKNTIESLSLAPNNINLCVGSVIQFEATGSQSNGTIGNVNGQVTWSSSNPSFATVNSTGIVTAVGPGNVTITASASGNISSSVALQVSPRPIPPIPSYSVGTNP